MREMVDEMVSFVIKRREKIDGLNSRKDKNDNKK